MISVYFMINQYNGDDLFESIKDLEEKFTYEERGYTPIIVNTSNTLGYIPVVNKSKMIEDDSKDSIRTMYLKDFINTSLNDGDIYIDLTPNTRLKKVDNIIFDTILLNKHLKEILNYKGPAERFYFLVEESNNTKKLVSSIGKEITFSNYEESDMHSKDSLTKKLYFIKHSNKRSNKVIILNNDNIVKVINDGFKK